MNPETPEDKNFWGEDPQFQDEVEALFGARVEGWDDEAFRHAYPNNPPGTPEGTAFCGYDGPSTWRGEKAVPQNVCPICLALLREKGFSP